MTSNSGAGDARPNSWLVINQERTPASKAITPHYDPADGRGDVRTIFWKSDMHSMTRRMLYASGIRALPNSLEMES